MQTIYALWLYGCIRCGQVACVWAWAKYLKNYAIFPQCALKRRCVSL